MLKAYAVLAPGNTYNPCTLIDKGECLDPVKGEYSGINASTETRTEGRVDRVYLHSIFGYPHTACSCFQNVAYYISEVDGIAIMDRGYKGIAPGEMTWTKLANMVAGRQYHDGAATIATQYLRSTKFLQADGGYQRVVWMTEALKNFAGDSIPEEHRARIRTETDVKTIDELKTLNN
jgi:acetyl-CoA decarbonylase/synthase complex subunit beta